MMQDSGVRKPVIGLRQFSIAGNTYIERNKEILGRLGDVVDVPRARSLAWIILRRLFTLRSLKVYDLLIVGWAENTLTDRGTRPTIRGRLEYFLFLWMCRQVSYGFVYVRHNVLPHNARSEDEAVLRELISKGQRKADAVVAHSPVYKPETNIKYVPHPLYDVAPNPGDLGNSYIVFGRIRPYKNIDVLIKAWKGPHELLIIGPCDDEIYLNSLKTLAGEKPVRFDVGFKSEADVAALISTAAGVIIVNDPVSVIVSGTVFFALSCGARVFVLSTPFHDWLRSTSLQDAVKCFESIPALTAGIAEDETSAAMDSIRIRAEAELLFGDQQVSAAWQSVMESLPLPGTAGRNGAV